jgi:hypothetical protein
MRILANVLPAALLVFVTVGAQAPAPAQTSARPAARAGGVPRTPEGKPDLQGNWTNATITPLERLGQGRPLVISEEAAVDEETRTRRTPHLPAPARTYPHPPEPG